MNSSQKTFALVQPHQRNRMQYVCSWAPVNQSAVILFYADTDKLLYSMYKDFSMKLFCKVFEIDVF